MIADKSLCADIANALGLGHCCAIDIRMRHNEIMTITATWHPTTSGVDKLPDCFKKYRLVEIEEEK